MQTHFIILILRQSVAEPSVAAKKIYHFSPKNVAINITQVFYMVCQVWWISRSQIIN